MKLDFLVVELENSGLSDDKWIEFFEALLCTEKLRKIGIISNYRKSIQ